MSTEHANVRDLFLKALELPPEQRERFLRSSGANSAVLEQVKELLANASTDTVLHVRSSATESNSGWSSPLHSVLTIFSPLASTRYRRWITALALLAALCVGGQWLRTHLKQVAETQVLSSLQAIEGSNAAALTAQVEEWRLAVEAVAAEPAGRQAIIEAIKQPTAGNLTRVKQHAGDLVAQGRFSKYYLTDAAGTLRAINDKPSPPSPATSYEMEVIGQAFSSGKTTITVDGLRRTVGDFSGQGEPGRASVTLSTPIVQDGERVGLFAVTRPLDGLVSTFLKARMFETGETYIFSPEGFMLSPSRFQLDMEKWGLVSKSAAGLVYLRDPGRRLETSPLAAGEQPGTWPQTMLLRTVLAARQSGDPTGFSGVLRVPYRDYRGELVMASWHWLPLLGVGFVTEVDVREIEELPGIVDRAILALLACLALGATWALITSGLLLRLRKERVLGLMGSYNLIEKIGEGGMGEVYLARHTLLKRTAALKLLRRDRLGDVWAAMFDKEVKTASQLRHPNTVGIYDFGRATDGTFYCAMEYLPGLDLGEWVKRKGAMPAGRSIHIVKQICSALSEAHEQAMLHCDVKPTNVMLCASGRLFDHVKLLDFGLAHSLRDSTDSNAGGTPYYTAPERLEADMLVDVRSDIFSLGVLWFYLLTARLPHGGGLDWVQATLTQQPAKVTVYTPVDPEIEQLIAICMARNADERPASVAVLLEHLETLAKKYPWTNRDAEQAWK